QFKLVCGRAVAAADSLCLYWVGRLRSQLLERQRSRVSVCLSAECPTYRFNHGRRSGFIATNADAGLRAGADFAQVDRARPGVLENFGLARAHLDRDRIEERSLLHAPAERRQSLDQSPGSTMDL